MVLMPFAAIAEAAGIATLVPLLNDLNQRDVGNARLAAGLFVATVIAAAILRFATLWTTQNVGQRISRDLMVEAQGVALAKPYEQHFADHSSDLIAAIQKIELLSFGMLLPVLQALASAAVVVAVSTTLFLLVPTAAVIALVLLALVFVLVALRFTLRRRGWHYAHPDRGRHRPWCRSGDCALYFAGSWQGQGAGRRQPRLIGRPRRPRRPATPAQRTGS